MMASNILSRLLPSASDENSDLLPSHEPPRSTTSSDPDNIGAGLDEENLGEHFEDQDLDHLLAEAAGSQVETGSTRASSPEQKRQTFSRRWKPQMSRPKWMSTTPERAMDEDDDVPESLLLEGNTDAVPRPGKTTDLISRSDANTQAGPSAQRTQTQWDAARAQQRLHDDGRDKRPRPRIPMMNQRATLSQDRKERAMWLWANVQDLDAFLVEIYEYYSTKGIYSIMLSKALWLLQIAFIVALGTFVSFCVDFSAVSHEKKLRDIVHGQCIQTRVHGFWSFMLWVLFGGWLYVLVTYSMQIPRLWQMHDFYHYLLDVPDRDIQTVSWQLVVARLMALRDSNIITAQNISAANRRFIGSQSKTRMDAHDIANRLMRRENYLIALFNKDILDLTVSIPLLGKRHFFSRTTEFHVNLAAIDFMCDEHGHVHPEVLSDKNRHYLIQALRRRFVQTGLISVVCAPFQALYFVIWLFFRYFTEFQKDPSQITARSFTRLAEWKFREFNELPHLFDTRKNLALGYSDRYLQQFPKDKTEQLAGFVAFVSSAILAVLGMATLLDSESFLGFQITDGRTAIFYITLFSTIWYAARNSGPQEEPTMDPKLALSFVIECTRYCPSSWTDRLHTDEVRQEFTSLYQLRLVNLFEELLSIFVTPYILIYQLPKCSERIVDFFREFTINVDGLGNVCSFAVFDFKKGIENVARVRPVQDSSPGLRDDYYATKDAKLVASVMGFQDTYVTNAASTRRFARKPGKFQFELPPQFDLYNLSDPHKHIAAPGATRTPQLRGVQHTPRTHAHAGRASPMHSILLDPHHQPAGMSALRGSPAQHAQTQLRGSRVPFSGVDESPEIAARDLTSRIIEEDSNLGESWRTTRAADVDEDDDAREMEDQRPGVLGLLYQFQKKQTQGRGPGAGVV